MDYDRLFVIADRARGRGRLAADDVDFIRDEVPAALVDYPRFRPPKKINHPSGFSVSDAPVHTFVKSALLLAGTKALGRRCGGHPFYEHVEENLAMGVMRSNFHGGAPRGTYCCSQCTLATLPVLEAGAVRYFDCAPLAKAVRGLIDRREWRFKTAPNPKMLKWALEGPAP